MYTSDASTSAYKISPLEEVTIEKLKQTSDRSDAKEYEGLGVVYTLVRIPEKLLEINREAYRPRYVSLGPFHYVGSGFHGSNDINVLTMESYKQEGMLRLLEATENPEETLSICKVFIEQNLSRICSCYKYQGSISPERVASIVLVDACFVLEFFLFRKDWSPAAPRFKSAYSIFWLMRRDATLLENQIPFFVIDELLRIVTNELKDPIDGAPLLIDRNILSFVRMTPENQQLMIYPDLLEKAHLLELVRKRHFPMVIPNKQRIPPAQILLESPRFIQLPSAIQLHAAGVRFERKFPEPDLLALQFSNGVLCIPPLVIHASTEILLVNLLAYEHLSSSAHPKEHIASYVILMSHLVQTKKDLEILEKHGIIVNEMGSTEDGSIIFNNISKHVILRSFCFKDLCQDINAFVDSHGRRYKIDFKTRFCKNPWTVTSLIAASMLLICTAAQTGYTIAAYYRRGVS